MKTGTMKKTTIHLAIALLACCGTSAFANPATAPELSVVFQQNSAIISWQPLHQNGILRYELQKSTDGEHFSYFCSFSVSSTTYRVEDSNLISHTQYYRLRLVNGNGHSIYSPVKSMDLKAVNAEIKILPTQINGRVYVWLPVNTRIQKATITDGLGREIAADVPVKNNVNMAALETGELQPGVYQLLVTTNRGDKTQLRFTKK